MEQLDEVRKAQHQRYQLHIQKILEEQQKKADEDNAKIQFVEETKRKLRVLGHEIHNYQNIREICQKMKEFCKYVGETIGMFQDYDLEDVKEIFSKIIYNLQSNTIIFNVTTIEEKSCVHEIQNDVQHITELLQLPENVIEFDVQMDVTNDADFAKLLARELNPKIY